MIMTIIEGFCKSIAERVTKEVSQDNREVKEKIEAALRRMLSPENIAAKAVAAANGWLESDTMNSVSRDIAWEMNSGLYPFVNLFKLRNEEESKLAAKFDNEIPDHWAAFTTARPLFDNDVAFGRGEMIMHHIDFVNGNQPDSNTIGTMYLIKTTTGFRVDLSVVHGDMDWKVQVGKPKRRATHLPETDLELDIVPKENDDKSIIFERNANER